jgi:hypothetical protein
MGSIGRIESVRLVISPNLPEKPVKNYPTRVRRGRREMLYGDRWVEIPFGLKPTQLSVERWLSKQQEFQEKKREAIRILADEPTVPDFFNLPAIAVETWSDTLYRHIYEQIIADLCHTKYRDI